MEEKEEVNEREAMAARQSALLDDLMRTAGIKNDAHLSRLVEMSPPVISKLRNGHLPMGATMLVALNEITGRSIRDMKKHLGYPVLPRLVDRSQDMVQHHPV